MKRSLRWDWFWIGLTFFAGLVFLFFAFKSFQSVTNYAALDQKSKASISSWEITKIKNYYYLRARYLYNTKQGLQKGEELFLTKYFLNYPAAFAALQQWAKQEWPVWYMSKNPQKSTLCKKIDLKKIVYSLLSLSVFLYFLILKYKVKKYGF